MLNQDWFAKELRENGHEVITAGMRDHLDVTFVSPFQSLPDLVQELSFGAPDVIVIHDESSPLYLTRLEQVEIPVVFYSVDTHHHLDVHSSFVYAFDHILVAHKDYVAKFPQDGAPVTWFPLWASTLVSPEEEKTHDVVFVGTLNRNHNPGRVDFFEKLKQEVDILVMTGDWKQIFPKSKCVVNQTVKGDLNFRVFEAMGSGSLLLTERTPNGLLDLFAEGQHLLLYEKGNTTDATEKINWIRQNPVEAERIAKQGRNEILSCHTPTRRATELLAVIDSLPARREIKRFSLLGNYTWLYRGLLGTDRARHLAPGALIEMMRLIHDGLLRDEPLLETEACFVILACHEYDRLLERTSGHECLELLSGGHAGSATIRLALAWYAKSKGDISRALSLLSTLDIQPDEGSIQNVFQRLDLMMQEILQL